VDLPGLIAEYGYWVLALGCLLEGETVLLLAGFAAKRGHLDLEAVIGIAAVAGFLGDQFYFWLGRRHGPAVHARWPALAKQTDRVRRWLSRSELALVVGVRFAYGLRIAGPVLIGMTPMPAARFAAYNALGAVIWAVLIGGLGYLFGHAAELMLGEVQRIEGWLLLGLLVAGASWWWGKRWFSAKGGGHRD
jgi:membrane protein DedA with SNARE-associated domain